YIRVRSDGRAYATRRSCDCRRPPRAATRKGPTCPHPETTLQKAGSAPETQSAKARPRPNFHESHKFWTYRSSTTPAQKQTARDGLPGLLFRIDKIHSIQNDNIIMFL